MANEKQVRRTADLLHSAAIHLLRRVGEADAASGLSAARLSALSVIVFRGPITLGELARAEGVRPPTMSKIVDGLEATGLAERRRHAADGRAILVAATPDGERVLQDGRARRVERLAEALARADPEELEAIGRSAALLERLFGIPGRPWRPLRRN